MRPGQAHSRRNSWSRLVRRLHGVHNSPGRPVDDHHGCPELVLKRVLRGVLQCLGEVRSMHVDVRCEEACQRLCHRNSAWRTARTRLLIQDHNKALHGACHGFRCVLHTIRVGEFTDALVELHDRRIRRCASAEHLIVNYTETLRRKSVLPRINCYTC